MTPTDDMMTGQFRTSTVDALRAEVTRLREIERVQAAEIVRLTALLPQTPAAGLDRFALSDTICEALQDSMGPDWTCTVGARLAAERVAHLLEAAPPPPRKWEDVDVERAADAVRQIIREHGWVRAATTGLAVEIVRAALSAIGAPSGGGGWRPISDPPPLKDPCMVIWAYPDGSDYDGPEEAHFITPDSYMGITNNLRRKGKGINWPTHWAPKPPAPSPRTGEDESAPSEVKG